MKQNQKTNQSLPDESAEQTVMTGDAAPSAASEARSERAKLDEPTSYEEAIEAILFAAGHPVSYEQLAKTLDLRKPIIRNIVKEYAERYNKSKIPRGVILLAYDEECQLCTKAEFLPYIRDALGIRRNGTLSASNMETLAIIAYHQPVTRSYIDAVRGVDSSYAVSSLIERGLIESKGRLDAPGRPTLLGTSAGFLRCFGLNSIDELPAISNEEVGALFEKVEEQMEAEAAALAAKEQDPNQITIDDLADAPAENGGSASASVAEDDILPPEISGHGKGEGLDADDAEIPLALPELVIEGTIGEDSV